eukprot:3828167-Prymnesium_polylepis.1
MPVWCSDWSLLLDRGGHVELRRRRPLLLLLLLLRRERRLVRRDVRHESANCRHALQPAARDDDVEVVAVGPRCEPAAAQRLRALVGAVVARPPRRAIRRGGKAAIRHTEAEPLERRLHLAAVGAECAQLPRPQPLLDEHEQPELVAVPRELGRDGEHVVHER